MYVASLKLHTTLGSLRMYICSGSVKLHTPAVSLRLQSSAESLSSTVPSSASCNFLDYSTVFYYFYFT